VLVLVLIPTSQRNRVLGSGVDSNQPAQPGVGSSGDPGFVCIGGSTCAPGNTGPAADKAAADKAAADKAAADKARR